MSKKIILFTLIIIVGLVFYYSWIPDPRLGSETYLPHWLVDWSNRYYNLRTAVPFVVFGNLLEAYTQKKSAYREDLNKKVVSLQNLGVAALVAFIAEGGQFLVKDRSPDIMDIYYGIVGSLIGATIYNVVNKLRLKNAK